MRLPRVLSFSVPLIFAGVAVASCGAPGVRARAPEGGEPAATRAAAARAARKARPAPPPATPPPQVSAPMKGEPAAKALDEARLQAESCSGASAAETTALVKRMRADVDAQFKVWHEGQMDCWEADRDEYRYRREAGDPMSRRVYAKPAATADSLGGALAQASAPPQRAASNGAKDKKAAPGGPAAATKASGTNNQVASVDEADIVKTDGRYVYLAANGALRIAEAMNPKMISVTKLGGTARELFVEGDRAVVYTSNGGGGAPCTYAYDCQFAGDGSTTKIVVLDIANREEPKVIREIELSGSLMAARRIGKAVHTVVADNDGQSALYETWPSDLDMCGTDEKIVRAKFAKLKAENERKLRLRASAFPTLRENGSTTSMCNGLLRTAMHDGNAFTSVVSFDLDDVKRAPTTTTLQSRPGAVFASADALYLSVVHDRRGAQAAGGRWYSFYPSVDEASEIHKFKIGSDARTTKYLGSGVVPGHVLNQFAMDEWYGYLRVATTRGRVPDPNVSSAVSVLTEGAGGNLVRVGAVENIAPGEDIRAVRFDDDRGYVVTFKKTDPLFVLDLFQPSKPRILGELKIPGFSTYMHRIDPNTLMSIGFDANDHGDFAFFDGVILQMFDVKNPTEPRLVHKEKIGSRGSSSQAATDHLAFNYFASEGLLAIPMTICEGGGDGSFGTTLAFSGLLVYDVDTEKGFTRLGGIDHGTQGVGCSTWWSNATSTVKRSIFLDDLVYSIASDRVKVQRMSSFGVNLADLSLVP
ncbi:MAG: beta-propeller domain-containing protein [Deltaproteobacteria bacterium]|nr:beta-propeller domain-containing protein [Deltaproteobacteria bacterium]